MPESSNPMVSLPPVTKVEPTILSLDKVRYVAAHLHEEHGGALTHTATLCTTVEALAAMLQALEWIPQNGYTAVCSFCNHRKHGHYGWCKLEILLAQLERKEKP